MLKILLQIITCLCCIVLQAQQNSAVLDSIIGKKGLKMEFDWAYPSNTGDLQKLANAGLFQNGNSPSQINVSGNSNYILIKKDSIAGNLSYFGISRQAGAYRSTNGGIQFNTHLPEKITIKKTKKGFTRIKFTVNDKNYSIESYQVILTLRNENISASVNSSRRSSISYRGTVNRLYNN